MFTPECEAIIQFSQDDVWAYIEGNMPEDATLAVKMHTAKCGLCLNVIAVKLGHLQEADPARYKRYSDEILAVRKAQLMRWAREQGKEVDPKTIITLEDYFREYIRVGMGDKEPEFLELWNSLDSFGRQELYIKIIKYVAEGTPEE